MILRQEYLNDIIITESSKLGVEDGACAPGSLRTAAVWGTLQCAPASQAGSLPYACMLGSLLLCISMMGTAFLTQFVYFTPVQENVIKVSFISRVVKPQTVIHSTRNFNSYNQATEGFYYLQLHPIFPKLRFYGELFYASYNKPALNINAHFQCIWHFQTAWRENLRKDATVKQLQTQHPCCFYC